MEPASGCGAPDCGPAWQDLSLLAVIMTPCDAQLGLLGLVDGVLLYSGSPLGRRQTAGLTVLRKEAGQRLGEVKCPLW